MDARDEDEPALTPEIRAIIWPRAVWPLVVTLLLAAALGAAALVATRTVLAG